MGSLWPTDVGICWSKKLILVVDSWSDCLFKDGDYGLTNDASN
jgi:hypothetical protein